jgi:hypothetical protein
MGFGALLKGSIGDGHEEQKERYRDPDGSEGTASLGRGAFRQDSDE